MGFAADWIDRQTELDDMRTAATAAINTDVIDLALGDPDLDTDPRIIESAFADALHGHTHYTPTAGDPEFLGAIRAAWAEDLSVDVAPEEVMVTASGCHAMWLLLSAVLDPFDEVVVYSPFFSPYPQQIRLAGGIPVEIACTPEDGFRPDPEQLRVALTSQTKAVILNTPCNPTGAVLSEETLQEFLDICSEYGLLLIADDIYTAYDYGKPFVAAASLPDARGQVATIRSFSKDFCMSGWRLGYVVAPSDVVAAMLAVNESNVFVAPSISQRAGLSALGLRKDIAATVKETYRERMRYAAMRCSEIPFLELPCSDAGLYAFIDIRKTGVDSAAFARRLLTEYSVSVVPGTAFGSAGEGFVRMALRKDIAVLKTVFDALANDRQWLSSLELL